MKKYSLLLLLPVFFTLSCRKELFVQPVKPCTGSISVNLNHPMRDSIQHIINKYIAKGIPGIQAIVKNNDGWFIANSGFASIEEKKAYEPCTTDRLFSITKTYTAALVMKQKEKGLLQLSKTLADYLPAIANKLQGSDKITIKMLLNHSSGLPDFTEMPAFLAEQLNNPKKQPRPEEEIALVYGKELLFEPGTDFSYSNTNYLLLQFLLEKLTGQSYSQLLATEIIQPLQLENTYYGLNEAERASHSFPNYYLDRYANNQVENVTLWNQLLANASYSYGGIAATGTDAILFYEALVKGQVVTPASFAEMQDWMQGKKSTQPDYGLGMEYFQYAPGTAPQLGHEGDGVGSSTLILYTPGNNTYLYLTCNVGRKLFTPYLFKIVDLKNELSTYIAKWR